MTTIELIDLTDRNCYRLEKQIERAANNLAQLRRYLREENAFLLSRQTPAGK